jgi:hypothetical protein
VARKKKKEVLDELENEEWWNPLSSSDSDNENSHQDMTRKIENSAARLARDSLLDAREVDVLQKALSYVHRELNHNNREYAFYDKDKDPVLENAFSTIRHALYKKQNEAWGRFFTFALSSRSEMNVRARKIALRKALAFFRDNKGYGRFYPRSTESVIDDALDVPFLDVALQSGFVFSSREPDDRSLMESILLEEVEKDLEGLSSSDLKDDKSHEDGS